MKKIFIIGAVTLSVFSFAKSNGTSTTKEVKKEIKSEKEVKSKRLSLLLRTRGYSVTFSLPCNGQSVTIMYWTDYNDGTTGFNTDLAWAVNSTVDEQCGSGSSGANTGV